MLFDKPVENWNIQLGLDVIQLLVIEVDIELLGFRVYGLGFRVKRMKG